MAETVEVNLIRADGRERKITLPAEFATRFVEFPEGKKKIKYERETDTNNWREVEAK